MGKNKRLLTEAELEEIIGEKLRNLFSGHVREYHAVAKAQDAKTLWWVLDRIKETLEGPYHVPEFGKEPAMVFSAKDWEALMWEVAND